MVNGEQVIEVKEMGKQGKEVEKVGKFRIEMHQKALLVYQRMEIRGGEADMNKNRYCLRKQPQAVWEMI